MIPPGTCNSDILLLLNFNIKTVSPGTDQPHSLKSKSKGRIAI